MIHLAQQRLLCGCCMVTFEISCFGKEIHPNFQITYHHDGGMMEFGSKTKTGHSSNDHKISQ